MAAKKKLKQKNARRGDTLAHRLKSNDDQHRVYCASDLMNDWTYIDFWNPLQNIPCIAIEWLFGGRGLLAGRILRIQAKYGIGKSSLMWLMYAAAQKLANAWCYHIETEAAPPPPDFIASYGCDPSDLVIDQPRSLEQCFERLEEMIAQIRGGVAEKVFSPTTGKMKKTIYDDPLDKDCASPIIAGVDSFSALGIDERVMQDVLDQSKTAQLAQHSRKMSRFLQERSVRLQNSKALLMLAAQEKAKINTGGGYGGAQSTSLADTPIGFHSTYSVNLTSTKYVNKTTGQDIGEKVTLKTTKNKLSPKRRELTMYLVRDHGFDLAKTDAEFLLSHSASPLADIAKRQGGSNPGIKCPPLGDGIFKSDEEFVKAFYANKELLNSCRENLRIRGFGFDFESKYMPSEEEVEDNTKSPKGESDLHGVEGSEKPV